jgi:hypothetical protein
MSDIKLRLERGVAVLDQLEQRRRDTRTPLWGHNAERLIIARELQEIEDDILRDPGALESQLVRIRRKREAE